MERLTISGHAKDAQEDRDLFAGHTPDNAIAKGKGTGLNAHGVTRDNSSRGRVRHVTRKVRSLLRGGQRGEVVVGGHAASISRVKRTRKVYLFFLFVRFALDNTAAV